ncbi:Zonadhesin [Leucoagaricus sp. SymC.cos]|nr:Zonadhesin [Leucoagaricus sp. SymC.cos]
MAATVESDPIPSALQPITNVDGAAVVSPTKTLAGDTSDVAAKENQDVEVADTQLSMNDSTAMSTPEVTKLPPPEELVGIITSVVSDAKKLEDATEAPIVEDVKDDSKTAVEEVAVAHSKDATDTSNASDATTVVATNLLNILLLCSIQEVGDTPREDAESDTKPEVVHTTTTTEETPSKPLSAGVEVNSSAEDTSTPTAESSVSPSVIESEYVSGSVVENDPVMSTAAVEVGAPVTEQEVTQVVAGELNGETTHPKEEEITKHSDTMPVEEREPVTDAQIIPAVKEVTSADSEDAKKEVEEAKPTEIEDKAIAEIKAKEIEELKVETEQPEVSIQIDEAEPTIEVEAAVEAPSTGSLAVDEDPIAVEVVAPTPALVDNRELAESDVEDVPAEEATHEEVTSSPVVTVEEESMTEGTETPRPEPEAELESKPAEDAVEPEKVVEVSAEEVPAAVEASPVKEVTPALAENVATAVEEPSVPVSEEQAKDLPAEAVVKAEEPSAESQPQVEKQDTEAAIDVAEEPSPAQEEVKPIVEETVVGEKAAVEEKKVVDEALAATQPEAAAVDTLAATEPEAATAQDEHPETPVTIAGEQSAEAHVETVDIPEAATDETPEEVAREEDAVEGTVAKGESKEEPIVAEPQVVEPVKEEVVAAEPVVEAMPVVGGEPKKDEAAGPVVEATPIVEKEPKRDEIVEPAVEAEAAVEELAPPVEEEPAKEEVAAKEPVTEEPAQAATEVTEVPEASVATEEPAVEVPVVAPEAAHIVVGNTPAEVPVPTETAVVETKAVEESAAEVAEQPVAEKVVDEPVAEVAEEPVAEKVVEDASEEPFVATAVGVTEEPVVDSAEPIGSTPVAVKSTAEPAEDQVMLVEAAAEAVAETSVEEPATQDIPSDVPVVPVVPVVEEPLAVEPTTHLAIPPKKPTVEPIAVDEPVTHSEPAVPTVEDGQGPVEVPAAEVPVEPVVQAEAGAEIKVDKDVEEEVSAEAAEELGASTAVERSADTSLDESVLASEVSEVDTTTETIIVPESVAETKEDVESTVEDINSPWTPSFQVTTIGHGVSLPVDEDIPSQNLDEAEVAKSDEPIQPEILVEDESTEAVTGETQPSTTEEANAPESATLTWTPSYSVHSQGSPSPTHASLEPEVTTQPEPEASQADSAVDEAAVPAVQDTAPPPADEDDEPSKDIEAPQVEAVPVGEPVMEVQDFQNLHIRTVVAPEVSSEEKVEEVPVTPAVVEQEVEVVSQTEEPVVDAIVIPTETAPTGLEEPQKSFIAEAASLTPPTEHERPASPSWVPSYSVNKQGSPLPQDASLPPIPSEESTEPEPTPTSVADSAVPKDRESQAAPTVVVNDSQPKEAPWTPSYSVTRQGADILEETQIEYLVPLDQTKDETMAERSPRRSLSEEMEDSGAFSPTALIRAGVAGKAAVLAASTILRKSSESPSGTDAQPTQVNGDFSDTPQEKTFPTVEIPDERFSATTLPPLDENNTLDTTSAISPDASPISPRKRLESTTSSRLFPGGWFSQIADERTSLEVAQGVFAGAKQGATVEETLVSPVVDPITPVREQSSSDKRRWCVIM